MSKTLSRHAHGLSDRILGRQVARHERTVSAFAGLESLAPMALYTVISDGVGLAALASLSDVTDLRILDGLRTSARAGAALFTALGASRPVEVDIGGSARRTIQPIASDSTASPRTWRWAFFAAVCTGDRHAGSRIAAADVAAIRQSPTSADEYAYLEIEALAAFYRGDANTPERLLAALRAADPKSVDAGQRNFVLDVANYELELFYRLGKGDAEAFNQTLAKALRGHKHYWGKGQRARDPMGQLAFGPLAAACMASDRGITVTVESDYVPRAIIEYPR